MMTICVVQYVQHTLRINVESAPSLPLIPAVPGSSVGPHAYCPEASLIL
jgi:hypothetical protein